MEPQQKTENDPRKPCPCPCRPRIEALETLVQERGRQLAELNLSVQNAGISFFCDDIASFFQQQNVNGPHVQQQVILNEATTAATKSEPIATTANLEDGIEDFNPVSRNDDGGPLPSISISNVVGAAATTTTTGSLEYFGTSNAGGEYSFAPFVLQLPVSSADFQVEMKHVIPTPAVRSTIKGEVTTPNKRRGSKSGSGTPTAPAARSRTTVTPTPPTKKVRATKPCQRYRCTHCAGSYFDRMGLMLHLRIHEKNIFGLGPELKTCDLCGLQMLASEPPDMHSATECQSIQQNRVVA